MNPGLPGFSFTDDAGARTGFDSTFCRAVAAAVLGNPDAIKYKTLTPKTRFTALRSGDVDMLSRETTWTFARDVDLKLTFAGVNYYDGQGFLVQKSLGVKSAKELAGASICIFAGTTHELNIADYFARNGMEYEPIPIETAAEARESYLCGRTRGFRISGLSATDCENMRFLRVSGRSARPGATEFVFRKNAKTGDSDKRF